MDTKAERYYLYFHRRVTMDKYDQYARLIQDFCCIRYKYHFVNQKVFSKYLLIKNHSYIFGAHAL